MLILLATIAFLSRRNTGWHHERLPSSTLFLVTDTLLAPGTPLHLFLPGTARAVEPLRTLMRSCVHDARELTLRSTLSGPDAETEVIEHWEAMTHDERARVWGVLGPLAGTFARFADRPALGFALLSRSSAGEGLNAQSRALLMADVADSWTLALDTSTPVDAAAWRARLDASLDSLWHVGWLEDIEGTMRAFAEVLGARWQPLIEHAESGAEAAEHAQRAHGRGWLDDELMRLAASKQIGVSRGVTRPRVRATVGKDLSAKVVRGRRGRLFLTNDSHDSHSQITGHRLLTNDELDAWARGTTARVADLGGMGVRFTQLIGPAPQVVHADDLPPAEAPAARRPVHQIQETLAELSLQPDLLYPVDEMIDVRAHRDPFSKTDSHWNDLGCFVAYESIVQRVERHVPIRRLRREDVRFHDTCYIGDLGVKLRPERASVFLRVAVLDQQARIVEDNRVRNHGRRTVFECNAAPEGTCIVFGDSWAYSMMLFLAESFRRVVFFHRVNVVDRAPILQERPALVLSILTERFCTALPLDEEAAPFDRVASRKIALGDVVAEPPLDERHPFLFSLALDRGLPRTGGFRLPDA